MGFASAFPCQWACCVLTAPNPLQSGSNSRSSPMNKWIGSSRSGCSSIHGCDGLSDANYFLNNERENDGRHPIQIGQSVVALPASDQNEGSPFPADFQIRARFEAMVKISSCQALK